MVTSHTRTNVWDGLLDSQRLLRYYEKLADRYRQKERVVRILLYICFVFGALITLLVLTVSSVPQFLAVIPFAGGYILVYWGFVLEGYPKKVLILGQVSRGCYQLDEEWQELWYQVNSDGADEKAIRERIRELSRRALEITEMPGEFGITTDEALNEESTEAADKVVADRYREDRYAA